MSFSLNIGSGEPLSLSSLTDLKHEAETVLKLSAEFAAHNNAPISALPANLRSTAIQYSTGNRTWTPGPISFTLAGGVSGKISILTEGELLSYYATLLTDFTVGPGADSVGPLRGSLAIPAGRAYVALELDFELSGAVTASYTSGVYGVSTSDASGASITVKHFCACEPATPLQQALTEAFQRFTLPLHPDTLAGLHAGDYLQYNFNANLQLGFGASIGFDKVFYASQYKLEIPRTASALNLNAAVRPEALGGAKLAYNYQYDGGFEMLLWREAADIGHVHLYRSKRQSSSTTLCTGLTLSAGASVSTQVMADQLTTRLTQALPDALQSGFSSKVLTPGFQHVTKYVDELNGKISSWFARVGTQRCTLDASIEQLSERFLLTDYAIDLTKPYQPAWKCMVDGRFVDALQLPGTGVSLEKGSGLESVFDSTTSINLNLFGALQASWTSSIISNSSLIYAGNKTFHLIAHEGRELLTSIHGGKKEIDLYFAAEVDLSGLNRVSPDVALHIILQATNDPKFGSYIGRITGLLSSGTAGAVLAAGVRAVAAQPDGVETLHLIFQPSAYTRLHASTIVRGKPSNEAADIQNYDAFAAACQQLFDDSPSNFVWRDRPLTYPMWRANNIASYDQWPAPATALPDRTSRAGYNPSAAGQLESVFPGIGLPGQSVFYCFRAAAQFMNLCDDLLGLATETTVNLDTWNLFIEHLQNMSRKDVNPYFIAPTALALAKLCGGAPTTVNGPVPSLPTGSSIAVTMTYQ